MSQSGRPGSSASIQRVFSSKRSLGHGRAGADSDEEPRRALTRAFHNPAFTASRGGNCSQHRLAAISSGRSVT